MTDIFICHNQSKEARDDHSHAAVPEKALFWLLNASLAQGIAVTLCTQEPYPCQKIHFPSQTNVKLME